MAIHHVYIIFSEKLNRFYVGNTDLKPEIRLTQHNDGEKQNAFTARGIPWTVFLVIPCAIFDFRNRTDPDRQLWLLREFSYGFVPKNYKALLFGFAFSSNSIFEQLALFKRQCQ